EQEEPEGIRLRADGNDGQSGYCDLRCLGGCPSAGPEADERVARLWRGSGAECQMALPQVMRGGCRMTSKPVMALAIAAMVLAGGGQATSSRTVSGGAMGAAGGAALGAIGGNAGLGAAIGAGAGLLGGYLYDQQQKGNID